MSFPNNFSHFSPAFIKIFISVDIEAGNAFGGAQAISLDHEAQGQYNALLGDVGAIQRRFGGFCVGLTALLHDSIIQLALVVLQEKNKVSCGIFNVYFQGLTEIKSRWSSNKAKARETATMERYSPCFFFDAMGSCFGSL